MPADFTLSCPSQESLTGAYRLSWEARGGPLSGADAVTFSIHEVSLAQGADQGAPEVLVYRGAHTATTVTGRRAGKYVYVLRTQAGEGAPRDSARCEVVVAPPSLGLSLIVFGVGFFVFVATLVVLRRGHRAHAQG